MSAYTGVSDSPGGVLVPGYSYFAGNVVYAYSCYGCVSVGAEASGG